MNVLPDEGKALRFGRNGGIVAAVTDPFCKVVCNVECYRGRCPVLVVNKANGRLSVAAITMNDNIGTKKVTVSKYQLQVHVSVSKTSIRESSDLCDKEGGRVSQTTYPVVTQSRSLGKTVDHLFELLLQ